MEHLHISALVPKLLLLWTTLGMREGRVIGLVPACSYAEKRGLRNGQGFKQLLAGAMVYEMRSFSCPSIPPPNGGLTLNYRTKPLHWTAIPHPACLF